MRTNRILISGAGLAGPALAYWLNQSGYAVTLVEKAPALRKGGYVIDFWGLGYDLAERMGLLAEIRKVGYQVQEMKIVGDRNEKRAGFGTRVFEELTGGRYTTLSRSDLSRLLFETIKDCTAVLFDTEVIALRQNGNGVDVEFSNGSADTFDLVIGADGLHSGVRRLAFGLQSLFEHHLGYCVAAFETQGYPLREEDVYLMYCQPGRMVGRFALHGDRTLFLFVFASQADTFPQTLEEQKAALDDAYRGGKWETAAILDILADTESLYFDRVSQIRMPTWSHGRVALCGDAAFCVSLLAGQGYALAMVAAYVLAGELKRANGDHRVAFVRYERVLRDYIALKQQGAERFAGAIAPKTWFGLWFRNMIVHTMRIPGIAKLAIGREMIDRLMLPDYGFSDAKVEGVT